VQQFVALLELDEHDCWFQQDGATSHTANETMNVLRDIFGDCLITKNMAAMFPRFFLSCHLKERA